MEGAPTAPGGRPLTAPAAAPSSVPPAAAPANGTASPPAAPLTGAAASLSAILGPPPAGGPPTAPPPSSVPAAAAGVAAPPPAGTMAGAAAMAGAAPNNQIPALCPVAPSPAPAAGRAAAGAASPAETAVEEMFVNENVAVSVAELLAEQDAWGAQITELQVFGSQAHPNGLLDMVHTAILACQGQAASLQQVARFCACCRWYKDVRGSLKVNSFASFQSETSFRTMLVQRCLNDSAHFKRTNEGGGVRYSRASPVPPGYEVPQSSRVSLSKDMLSTPLWQELTQKALNDRSMRLASGVILEKSKGFPYRPEEVIPLGRGSLGARALKVLEYIASIEGAEVFRQPVDPVQFPMYYAGVKTPMDLGTVEGNLKAARYSKVSNFALDVRTTFRNCLLVNTAGSSIAKVARTLLAIFEQVLEQFVLDTSLDLSLLDTVWRAEECQICQTSKEEEHKNMILCDGCDSAYHIHCLEPPLAKVPEGDWFCNFCVRRRKTTFTKSCKFCHDAFGKSAGADKQLQFCRVDLEHFDPPWDEKPGARKPLKGKGSGVPKKKQKVHNPVEGVHFTREEDGLRVRCMACGKVYGSEMGLKGHFTKGCDGGQWHCEWCNCSYEEASGRSPGPNGPGTLCAACSSRHRAGHTGPPKRDEQGNYICEACGAKFETIRGLGSHRRGCTGGTWRCQWCQCEESETTGKAPGPTGAKTLCATCGSRFRAGHTKMIKMNTDGKYQCEGCGKQFESIVALGGHKRYCDGGMWKCGWCGCDSLQANSKSPGPDGAKTLCSACSARWRSGHTEAPQQDGSGMYICGACGAKFETIRGLGSHKRGCTGGSWRCEWCKADETMTAGKAPGPNGAKTLCSTCGSRYRSGHTKMILTKEVDGKQKYACENCPATFDSVVALGGHRRYCDGGKWRCQWCEATYLECRGKAPGPQGPKTLCAACGSRHRAGHVGPPKIDEDGMYVCNTCQKRFSTIPALGGHRRYCDPSGKHDSQHNDDLEMLSEILLTAPSTAESATKPPEDAAASGQGEPGAAASAASPNPADGEKEKKAEEKGDGQWHGTAARKETANPLKVDEAKLLGPAATPLEDSAATTFDIAAVVDFVFRFGSQLELGVVPLSCEQLHALLTTKKKVKHVPDDTLAQLHIGLVQLLMDDVQKAREWELHFFKANLKENTHLLDEHTWPEILRRFSHMILPGIPANLPALRALQSIHTKGYDATTIEEKLTVLGFLCCEVLSTRRCYDLINGAQDVIEVTLRERMEAGMAKKRMANEKEAESWLGQRVKLMDGSFGKVESASRGVFRIKLEDYRGKVGIKLGSEATEKSKGKAGGICLRRANEIMRAGPDEGKKEEPAEANAEGNAEGNADPAASAEQPGAAASSEATPIDKEEWAREKAKEVSVFEQFLEPTEEEKEKKKDDDNTLQEIAVRTECLGEDRYYNTYWWFKSNPHRLYVRDAPEISMPINVAAFRATEGSIQDRRAAAEARVIAEFSVMPQKVIEDMLDAAEVDRSGLTEKDQLVKLVTSPGVYSQNMQLKAIKRALLEDALAQLKDAPTEVLRENLLSFGVEIPEETEKEALLQIIVDKKLTGRLDGKGHVQWKPLEGSMKAADDMEAEEAEEEEEDEKIEEEDDDGRIGSVRERRFLLPPGPARDAQIEKDRKQREIERENEKKVREQEQLALESALKAHMKEGVDKCPWCIKGSGKLLGHMGQHRRSLMPGTEGSDAEYVAEGFPEGFVMPPNLKEINMKVAKPVEGIRYGAAPKQAKAESPKAEQPNEGAEGADASQPTQVDEVDIAALHRKVPDTAYGGAYYRAFRGAEPVACPEGSWAYYDKPSQVETLMAHLNSHGPRERQLSENLELYKEQILTAMANVPEPVISTSDRQSRSNEERPPTMPSEGDALDHAKTIMVQLRQDNVSEKEQHGLKDQLVEWFKALLECESWDKMEPLIVKLAEMIDLSAHKIPKFAKNSGLINAWRNWLTAWYNSLDWPEAQAAEGQKASRSQMMFALYGATPCNF